MKLYDYQVEALDKMHNGCILNGRVGSGKSLTAIAYYYKLCGGSIEDFNKNFYKKIKNKKVLDLYIITTARKRDTREWDGDMATFLFSVNPDLDPYDHKVTVDSWNNIKKYSDIRGAFFIFDEQRLVGKGEWVKTFYKIAKNNQWILLTATPGDTWTDYFPVFKANGYFKTRSEFHRDHCIFNRFTKYPSITGYFNEGRLMRYKREILVDMNYTRPTETHSEYIYCDYDIHKYKSIIKERFNYEKNEPYKTASEICQALRKVVNSSQSRIDKYKSILHTHNKVIVFYNYDYELDILRKQKYPHGFEVAEWNGHKHEPLPTGKKWVYLVQYAAGAEGWNCITTDTIIFWSSTYSYKQMIQAMGRIDRNNTPYKDLFYYHLTSRSSIDITIKRTLDCKKQFNENSFISQKLYVL